MSLGTKPVAKCVFLLLITNVIWVPDANAYLDPATGGMLVSALLGLFATVVFLLKTIQYKVKALVSRLFGTKLKERERYSIIFYSEGRQYWSTFEPVLRALDADQIPCTYLTSGADDPGLSYRGENVRTRYIGEGYRAYALLNFLDADICVLTTPGLDVKQIKRSKSVKHYVHLVHSVADIGTYQQFSFDYFDTILTSSEHQIRALRELEKIRGTKEKRLLETGCTYMDLLQARVSTTDCSDDDNGTRVLIAPTWGANGLLSRFGATLPQTLLDAGYEVILRPHPQSYISEKETLDRLMDELSGYPNLTWDESTDAFESMRQASVLVSDVSAIAFDFAFIFGKPIVTVRFDFHKAGMEASDLPWEPWETTVLDKLGLRLDSTEIDHLPERISEIADNDEFQESIQIVKSECLFNPGTAGIAAARQIAHIHQELCGDEASAENAGTTSESPAL